mmetsp:Transcript_9111/g.10645  ORF Transcript_9111/g.10645 Transcript_9111/m.10645 type:complete len:361 (+) Transcript_9111:54-1136(+)
MDNLGLSIIIAICSIVVIIVLLIVFLLIPRGFQNVGRKSLESKLLNHVIVTGGSSGIGLCVAEELVKRKCKTVTLLARNQDKMTAAKNKLVTLANTIGNTETVIETYSVDITDVDATKKAAQEICSNTSAPDIIFNIAGLAKAATFLDTDPKEFERVMQCNFHGTVNVTHSFLPFMLLDNNKNDKTAKAPRTIVFTSSGAGQLGIYGYTAYSASKFALRGLAEALQMETLRENIFIQIVNPPDVDTPGYRDERIGMPEETNVICATAGLFKPEDVARKMVSSAIQRRPKFNVYFGLEGWMLASLTAGMSPVHSIIDALCQIFLMGLFRFISLFYLMDFRRIVVKVGNRKENEVGKDKKSD